MKWRKKRVTEDTDSQVYSSKKHLTYCYICVAPKNTAVIIYKTRPSYTRNPVPRTISWPRGKTPNLHRRYIHICLINPERREKTFND